MMLPPNVDVGNSMATLHSEYNIQKETSEVCQTSEV
jgi:hypothetical protein